MRQPDAPVLDGKWGEELLDRSVDRGERILAWQVLHGKQRIVASFCGMGTGHALPARLPTRLLQRVAGHAHMDLDFVHKQLQRCRGPPPGGSDGDRQGHHTALTWIWWVIAACAPSRPCSACGSGCSWQCSPACLQLAGPRKQNQHSAQAVAGRILGIMRAAQQHDWLLLGRGCAEVAAYAQPGEHQAGAGGGTNG